MTDTLRGTPRIIQRPHPFAVCVSLRPVAHLLGLRMTWIKNKCASRTRDVVIRIVSVVRFDVTKANAGRAVVENQLNGLDRLRFKRLHLGWRAGGKNTSW